MGIRPTKRSGYKVALTAAAVTGLSMLGVSTAQATPPPPTPPQCSADDVTVSTTELPAPNEQERLYQLTVQANPGVTCLLSGAPQNLNFYGQSGPLPLNVETPAPGTGGQAVVAEGQPGVAYLSGPKTDGPARAASVSLTLPCDDVPIRTGWVRGGVDGPLRVGNFTTAVS